MKKVFLSFLFFLVLVLLLGAINTDELSLAENPKTSNSNKSIAVETSSSTFLPDMPNVSLPTTIPSLEIPLAVDSTTSSSIQESPTTLPTTTTTTLPTTTLPTTTTIPLRIINPTTTIIQTPSSTTTTSTTAQPAPLTTNQESYRPRFLPSDPSDPSYGVYRYGYVMHPEIRIVEENWSGGCGGHYGGLKWNPVTICLNWHNTPQHLQEAVVIHEYFHAWAWALQEGIWPNDFDLVTNLHIEENSAECAVREILGPSAITTTSYDCDGESYDRETILRVVKYILGEA